MCECRMEFWYRVCFAKSVLGTNTALYSICNTKISNKSLQELQAKQIYDIFFSEGETDQGSEGNALVTLKIELCSCPSHQLLHMNREFIYFSAVSLFHFRRPHNHNNPLAKDFSVVTLKE